MEFVRTEVDRVPAIWAPAEAELQAGLVIRVGSADETLVRHGITHLVEHLVLHRLGQTDYHFNGAVGQLTTTFYTQGGPDEVAHFFAAVCRALRDLPMDRLATEKGILRTEWSGRGRPVSEPLSRWRYGPASYGLSSYPEYGLHDLTPDDLRSWVASWFTRGNAALWVAGGPPPPQLRLDLPDGTRMPAPRATSALPRTPAFFTADTDGIALDAVVRRDSAASVFAALLDRRMQATLRHQRGTSYAVQAAYEVRDGEHGTVTAFADALPDKLGEVSEAFVDVLADVAANTFAEDDLEAIRARARAALWRPGAAAAIVPAAVADLLTGAPVLTPQQRWDRIREVSAEQVRLVAQEALASGLLMLPEGQAVGRAGFTRAPAWSSSAVTGRSFRAVDHPVDRRQLLIGPDGVSVVDGRRIATVRYADCAGMLSWSDGARSLFGSDGVNVHVEPRLWRLPRGPLEQVDSAIAAGWVAHMPERPAESLPKPRTGTTQRLRARLRQGLSPRVLLPIVLLVALAVSIAAVMADANRLVKASPAVLIGITVSLLGALRRAPRRP